MTTKLYIIRNFYRDDTPAGAWEEIRAENLTKAKKLAFRKLRYALGSEIRIFNKFEEVLACRQRDDAKAPAWFSWSDCRAED